MVSDDLEQLVVRWLQREDEATEPSHGRLRLRGWRHQVADQPWNRRVEAPRLERFEAETTDPGVGFPRVGRVMVHERLQVRLQAAPAGDPGRDGRTASGSCNGFT